MSNEQINMIMNEHITHATIVAAPDQIVTAIRAAIAVEREACAKVCEEKQREDDGSTDSYYRNTVGTDSAAAIRKRGTQ